MGKVACARIPGASRAAAGSATVRALAAYIALGSLFEIASISNATANERMVPVEIRVAVEGGESVAGTLHDNAAARDFASLLPLTIALKDYASTEKVADLPKRLDTTGAPAGHDPSPGDIAHYAPWGNIAFFYRDFGYSRGLVSLGRLESVPAAFSQPGPVVVTISRR